jgi:hypothetical protein
MGNTFDGEVEDVAAGQQNHIVFEKLDASFIVQLRNLVVLFVSKLLARNLQDVREL